MTGVFTLGESLGSIRGDGIGGLEHLALAHIDTGGAEGNVAIGVARLGGRATWLGRVGDDALGRRVTGDLRSESVVVRAIVDTVLLADVVAGEGHAGLQDGVQCRIRHVPLAESRGRTVLDAERTVVPVPADVVQISPFAFVFASTSASV